MLLSKIIKVKSSKYYKDLGYDINERYIEIDIKDLPKGSNSIIESSCDYCDNIKEISYKNYNKNISINGKFSCSIKCGCLKSKETNLEKYGVESTNQLESKKLKNKESLLKKYGVDHVSKLDSVRKSKSDKMKDSGDLVSNRIKDYRRLLTKDEIDKINKKRVDTNLEKYGKENVSQIDETKMKVKKSFIDKYGGYTYQSNILMYKVIDTNLEKYGVTFSSSSDIIKDKIKSTNMDRYGFECVSKSPIIKSKVIETNLEKYGVENIMFLPNVVKSLNDKLYQKYKVNSYFKTDEFRNSLKYNPIGNDIFRNNLIINNNENYIRYIDDNISEFSCDCGHTHTFLISSINFHNRSRLNIPLCTVCYPIGDQKSIKEKELLSFIKSVYENNIISGYRDGLEIDIYLPDLNIGFEFNGLYWHSEEYKEKNYHINKTNHFKSKGIRIIHIWEDDWDNKRDIIKSQIRNWLDSSINKIYARKCDIRNVNKLEYKEFLNNNHIQGFIRSIIRIGLFYNDELVSLMTFDNLEGRGRMEEGGWNLSRFCSKINTNIIGGSSKLLKYFIKVYNPLRVISYADLDWSTGDLYHKLGFNLSNTSKPDYKYLTNNTRLNKQKFTKNKLKNMGHDISKPESKITNEMGLVKIYSCGQLKFEITFPNF